MKNVLDFFRSFFSGCRVNKLRYIAPGTHSNSKNPLKMRTNQELLLF